MMANETVVQQPFKAENMTRAFTRHAIDFLEWNAVGGRYAAHHGVGEAHGHVGLAGADVTGERQPFFFMFNFMHVHTPLFSSPPFANVSANGRFGDNVAEMDDAVGQVLATLDRRSFLLSPTVLAALLVSLPPAAVVLPVSLSSIAVFAASRISFL